VGQAVAFFEVTSTDHARAQEFYSELFGWQVAADQDGYGLVDTGAGESAIGGGIGPAQGPGDVGVKIYVRVDDLEASLARAERLGRRRLVEPADLPGDFGRFALAADPDGNPIGLWA
jgi:uncharacterized protein